MSLHRPAKETLNIELPSKGLTPKLLIDGESLPVDVDEVYKIHALADTTFTTLTQNGTEDWSGITLSDTDELRGNFTDITINTGTIAVYPRP